MGGACDLMPLSLLLCRVPRNGVVRRSARAALVWIRHPKAGRKGSRGAAALVQKGGGDIIFGGRGRVLGDAWWRCGTSLNTKEDTLAMFDHYDEEPPPEVSADPSCSRNSIDEDDDWVIVKKQKITVLIPPPLPDFANSQANMHKQCGLTRSSVRNGDAARKKHPEQLSAKKFQDSPPEGDSREKAPVNHSESVLHKGIPKLRVEIPLHSPAAPVAESESIKGVGKAVQGLFHQDTRKVTSSVRIMEKLRMPVVSSHVANKITRARLLEKRVARLGGLKNWLFDCGLGWFIDILDSEKLGMYQLVSLTMEQLKEMGLVAVGPRRKLIHAIDSLSRPHQLEMVS